MKRPHFALPEIYGEPLSFYEILSKLCQLLNDETDDRKNADDELQHNINTEASTREHADNTLQQNINAEENAREQADASLRNDLTTETNAREQADNTLQQNINTEATTREQGDTALRNDLTAETNAREQADNTLQQNINTEATTREQADTDLRNDLTAETNAREQADNTLQQNINNEKIRATNRENEIESSLTMHTQEAVNEWLNAHPEATTTVQDHSLTIDKMVVGTLGYVTPEMFGAIGDGVTDDSNAIEQAINTHKLVFLDNKYLVKRKITCVAPISIMGSEDSMMLLNDNGGGEHVIDFSGNGICLENVCFNVPPYNELINTASSNGIKIHDCKYVYINNCNFVAKETKINGFLDLYNNWENVILENCFFDIDTTYDGNVHGGGVWFRDFNNTGCKNLIIDKCTFVSKSRDEAFSVWSGNTTKCGITNVKITNTSTLKTNAPWAVSIGGVKDTIIDSCIIDGKNVDIGVLSFALGGVHNENFNCSNSVFYTTNNDGLNVTIQNHEVKSINDYSFNNCKFIGKSFYLNTLRFNNCYIKTTNNKGFNTMCEFDGCIIDNHQASNQFLNNNNKLTNCKINHDGNSYFINQDNASLSVFKDCVIKATNNFGVFNYGNFQFINNKIIAELNFYSISSISIIYNNIFSAWPNWNDDNQPIGKDTNIVVNTLSE